MRTKVSLVERYLHFCFAKHFLYAWKGFTQVGRKAAFGNPCGLRNVFVVLGSKVYRVGVEHIVPPGVFQVPHSTP